MFVDDPRLSAIEERFARRPFRVRDAVAAGIPRRAVYELRDRGMLVRLSRGVWQHAGASPSSHSEFAAVAARAPRATICLTSGLEFWELTDDLPATVHLAVARGAHWPRIDEPATTLHRFAAATFAIERLALETETGEPFWIYSAERCIVDALRLQRSVGRDVALAALRRYLDRPGARPLTLVELARELGGARQVTQAVEVLLA